MAVWGGNHSPPKQRENPAAWTRSVTGEFKPLITRLVNHVSTIETLRARTEELPRNQNPPTQ